MLDKLDAIDWAQLSHAYGPATDVPDLLRALQEQDEAILEETFETLFSTIWHQGTVYEASAYAVPFLIELLLANTNPDKAGILNLLGCLANGHSYLAAHARDENGSAEQWRKILAERGQDLETQKAQELRWVKAAHDAVAVGVPIYLTLLDDNRYEVRYFAVQALANFPEYIATIMPRLHTRLNIERNPHVKQELTQTIATFVKRTEEE